MQYDTFVDQVQAKAGVGSRDEAIRLAEATLETLGERLYRTDRGDIGAQLGHELEQVLLKRAADQTTRQDVDRFGIADFYHRVSARSGIAGPDATEGARAVVSVLREALSPGAWRKVPASLPTEYRELWEEA